MLPRIIVGFLFLVSLVAIVGMGVQHFSLHTGEGLADFFRHLMHMFLAVAMWASLVIVVIIALHHVRHSRQKTSRIGIGVSSLMLLGLFCLLVARMYSHEAGILESNCLSILTLLIPIVVWGVACCVKYGVTKDLRLPFLGLTLCLALSMGQLAFSLVLGFAR